MMKHEYTVELEARSAWHKCCEKYGIENCNIDYRGGIFTIRIDESGYVSRMAGLFGVDVGALRSLIEFVRSNIERSPGGLETLASASTEEQERVIRAGVTAWHKRGQKIFSELREGRSEWAIGAREQIAADVWHTLRILSGTDHH